MKNATEDSVSYEHQKHFDNWFCWDYWENIVDRTLRPFFIVRD